MIWKYKNISFQKVVNWKGFLGGASGKEPAC